MNEHLFHGTSLHCLRYIMTGKGNALPTYEGELQSLGGTYLANTPNRASYGAFERVQAFPEEGPEVIIVVKPMFELFPDEDWVSVYRTPTFQREVKAGEHKDVLPFFEELLADYPGDVWDVNDEVSLVSHYLGRFEPLNAKHAITGQVTMAKYSTARQKERLTPEQVIAAIDWKTKTAIDLESIPEN